MRLVDLFPIGLSLAAMIGMAGFVLDGKAGRRLKLGSILALVGAFFSLGAGSYSRVPSGSVGAMSLFGMPSPEPISEGVHWHHPHAEMRYFAATPSSMRFEKNAALIVDGLQFNFRLHWQVSPLAAPYLAVLIGEEDVIEAQLRETVAAAVLDALASQARPRQADTFNLAELQHEFDQAIQRDVSAALRSLGFSERQAETALLLGPVHIESICKLPCLD